MKRLADVVAKVAPTLDAPAVEAAVRSGRVMVDGRMVLNPAAQVRAGARVTLSPASPPLRGIAKLEAALDAAGVDPSGLVCLDVGASAGGFTTALLRRGARLVYAVDAGHGQLVGSLRQDPRVVNLEATNLGDLTREHVPIKVDLFTVDVSYLSLVDAVAQLDRVDPMPGAQLLGLVKPMFELKLATLPTSEPELVNAFDQARAGITKLGWTVAAGFRSPVLGANGAVEWWIHARK